MDILELLVKVLGDAARRRKLVSYRRFHSCFSKESTLEDRYFLLGEAVKKLANPRWIDYGAVLTLDNGLPGDEFFVRFRRLRRAEFEAVMGIGTCGRSVTKRRTLVEAERSRVFDHASERGIADEP